jgi:hypothetical protein
MIASRRLFERFFCDRDLCHGGVTPEFLKIKDPLIGGMIEDMFEGRNDL